MGTRDLKSKKQRADLISASRQLFREKGFSEVTLQTIAAKVTVVPRTVIREFGSKENLAVAPIADLDQMIVEAFKKQPHSEVVITSLHEAIRSAISGYEASRDQVNFVRSMVVQFGSVSDALHAHYGQLSEKLAAAIAERLGVDGSTDHQPLLLATVTCSIFRKSVDIWITKGASASLPHLVDQGFTFFQGKETPARPVSVALSNPDSLRDLVFPSSRVRKQITDWIAGRGKKHLLLHGPSGSGKTSLANVLPQLREQEVTNTPDAEPSSTYFDCRHAEVGTQLDNLLSGATSVSFNVSGLRYFVLDEFDNWPMNFQKQLKNTFAYAHVRFIVITNKPDKIDDGIANRCESVEWDVPSVNAALPRLRQLAKSLGKQIPDDVLRDGIYSPEGWREMTANLEKY